MLDTLVESRARVARGNYVLIAVRLVLAVLALAVLLLQESRKAGVYGVASRPVSASGEVTALLFSPDGKRLYSGGSDATLRRWDPVSGDEVEPAIEGHGDLIRQLSLSPGGAHLASAGNDMTVRISDLRTGSLARTIMHEAPVSVVAWSPDGGRVVSGGGENPLQIWDAQSGRRLAVGGVLSKQVVFAAFLPRGDEVVSADAEGWVRFWSAAGMECTAQIEGHFHPILCGALSPDGRWLVTGGSILRVWNVAERRLVRACEAHEGKITALCFDGSGTRFLSASRDRRLMLWSVDALRPLKVFGEHPDWVLAAALHPNGRLAATGTGDRSIRLWDTESGRQVRVLAGHRRTLRAVARHPEARREPGQAYIPLSFRPEGIIVIVMCFLSIFYLLALRRPELAPKLAALQIVVDVAMISALVYHTGGVDSPFVTLYVIAILAAAFVLSWRAAVLVAALAGACFALLTLAYGVGYIPKAYLAQVGEAPLRKFRDLSGGDYLLLLLLPICAFFLVAILGGNLARRLTLARLLHHEVLEGIGEGVLVLGLDRRVLYGNQEARELLKWEDRLERRALASVLGEAVDAQAARALAERVPRRWEITHHRKDGLLIPFALRALPVLDPEGPPRGLILVLDDITAEKKMEEFNKHRERLETMSRLSATIAHEIRNPLASIRGAVQEIARSVPIAENKKILIEIVLSESDRLDQIITDFLRYARVRAPKLHEVDLRQLLQEVRLLLAARPEGEGVEIGFEAQDNVGSIRADPEQMRQVFLNLGLNALQAMEGRPQRRLTYQLQNARLHQAQGFDPGRISDRLDRPGVRIALADSGKGMPEDVRKQIFEPFFTTKPEGTGLGLAIVDRIITGHEGLISVTSTPEVGTTFVVWLPGDLRGEPEDGRGAGSTAKRA